MVTDEEFSCSLYFYKGATDVSGDNDFAKYNGTFRVTQTANSQVSLTFTGKYERLTIQVSGTNLLLPRYRRNRIRVSRTVIIQGVHLSLQAKPTER